MTDVVQKVALPAFLKKKLHAYRVGEGQEQHYLIKDHRSDEVHKLETWQFFILEILPGCNSYQEVIEIFKDRFGQNISVAEIEELFTLIADKKLFGLSAVSNIILSDFNQKRLSEADRVSLNEVQVKKTNDTSSVDVTSLPPGVKNVLGYDEDIKSKGWMLFNPKKIISGLSSTLMSLKYVLYLLPLLLISSFFLLVNNFSYVQNDILYLLNDINIVGHAVISMFTVNIAVTILILVLSHQYRGNIKGIGIVFYFGFFPRFCAYVGNVDQFTKRERIWLHAGPLLLRLTFLSLGLLVWYNSRGVNELWSSVSLVVSIASALSLMITANPLVKSNGYHLVSTLLNEPNLRRDAYRALLNKIKGNSYNESDSNILVAYALVSTLFMVLLFCLVMLLLAQFLKIQFGGAGVLLTLFIATYFIIKMIGRFQKISAAHDRALQFKRWRDRTLISKEELDNSNSNQKTKTSFVVRSAQLVLLVALFLPYKYEPGGNFHIMPYQQQEVTTEIAGIVNEINFDGGDFIDRGELIGELSHIDVLAQVNIYNAKINEQQAVIQELRSRPLLEEVKFAEDELQVEIVRTDFSKAKVKRLQNLYDNGAVSFEELDDAKRQYEIDLAQVVLKKTNLDIVKLGATPDQLEAAEAKLQSYVEERNYHLKQVEMSQLKMPFNGRLVTMHLDKKIGSFLEKGEPLAVVENTERVLAQIDIPEADAGYLEVGSKVRIKPYAFHSQEYIGNVVFIDSTVVEDGLGKVIRITSEFNNEDGSLKTGMTGYAKVASTTLPVWEVFSMAILRFIEVEMWSWLP